MVLVTVKFNAKHIEINILKNGKKEGFILKDMTDDI